MSKALITHSYFYPLDSKQWKFRQPYPPLGTLLAAAVTREAGMEVSVWDSNLEDGPSRFFPVVKKEKPKYVILYDDGFNYLTKMCLTTMREAAFRMMEEAAAMNSIVIVNSSDAADHYEKYFAHGAHYVIKGEGEDTLKELLLAIEANESVSSINGLIYKKEKELIINSPRQVMRNLDSLPMPAWDLIDMEPYRKIWNDHHGYFSLNIATTRGCPFKCNWCAKPIYGNRYNSRSAESVVNEIELLILRYQPDHFWMCDDIFGLKPGWIQKFNTLLAERRLKIRYKIQSRVDLLLKEDTIQALAQSGVDTVWVGAESGSQKILDAMDKETKVEEIYKASALLKAHGIKVAFFLQFGYSGETIADINSTLRMVLKLMPDEIGISVSYPLPGTVFYDKVKNQLHQKQNWKDSDDLAMMFEGTYGSYFYKTLHRYIHNRYRIRRGWLSLLRWMKNPSRLPVRSIASMVYNVPLSLLHRLELKRIELLHD
ncbi:MAG: radical SAM protein [Azospira oryzae]|nr:MAG: radical SAM protein [Azospira oryzae]